ncbi:MAG: hypothetical protein KIT60_29680 [Burkholderiaceae bacterium]|nr:hypothetical protein [Burkholderiaceae bacterium]
MLSMFIRLGAPWALILGICAAMAQPARGRADPLDAAAAVPPVRHESALKTYRRFDDAPPVSWRQANETVERIGGWRSYAREASQPPAATSAPPAAPAPRAEPSGHGGHKR